jgi:AraC-like DNA-binding protein
MDLLADVLQHAGLRRRVLNQLLVKPGTLLKFPCDKSIGFHVVTQGEVALHVEGTKTPIVLRKGDVAWMARGKDHEVRVPKGAGEAGLVTGAYQFWNAPVLPLFRELPPSFILRAETLGTIDQLSLAIGLLSEEVRNPQLGSETAVHGLLDVLFAYLTRQIVAHQGKKPETWSHAVADAQIRRSVELLHSDLTRDWTLNELAREVGLSRAGFAQKFREAMGDTPLHYLTTVRMQRAMGLLSGSDDKLDVVAAAVGYSDAFGFSKVFKKVVGVSPREFRTRDEAEKGLAWRY